MGKSKYKLPLIISGAVLVAFIILMQLNLDFSEPDSSYTPGSGGAGSGSGGGTGDFRPSGTSRLATGRGVRDNQILSETVVFSADSGGMADVHAFATLNETGLSKVFFHFVDSYGFEQRSGEYSVPRDAKNTTIWTSLKLRRGSWKVTLKDVFSDKELAVARFSVKSDDVQKILDGTKDPGTGSGSDGSSYDLKIGTYADAANITEANVINANQWGQGTVYAVAVITVANPVWVYFHFVDENKNEQQSAGYTAGANPQGYRLWIYQSLRRGRWTVTLRDNKKTELAKKQFLVR